MARKASCGARQLLRPNQRVDALGAHPGERDMESRRKKKSGKEVQGYIRLNDLVQLILVSNKYPAK